MDVLAAVAGRKEVPGSTQVTPGAVLLTISSTPTPSLMVKALERRSRGMAFENTDPRRAPSSITLRMACRTGLAQPVVDAFSGFVRGGADLRALAICATGAICAGWAVAGFGAACAITWSGTGVGFS